MRDRARRCGAGRSPAGGKADREMVQMERLAEQHGLDRGGIAGSRLLGVGAGSTALLAALDPETSDRIIETIAPSLRRYPGLTVETMRRIVDDARRTGFAVSQSNVVNGVIGIGMAIPKPGGIPTLALSIAALALQTGVETIEIWKQIIKQEIDAVLDA